MKSLIYLIDISIKNNYTLYWRLLKNPNQLMIVKSKQELFGDPNIVASEKGKWRKALIFLKGFYFISL